MERYINADEAMRELAKVFMPDDYPKIVRAISRTRTADVVLQKKGKWVRHSIGHENVPWGFDCSACGEWFVISKDTAERYHYCPNCGAEMESGE